MHEDWGWLRKIVLQQLCKVQLIPDPDAIRQCLPVGCRKHSRRNWEDFNGQGIARLQQRKLSAVDAQIERH